MLMAEVSGWRVLSRQKLDWIGGVKVHNHGQPKDDGGGYATMKGTEGVLNSGTCLD